MSVPLDGNQTTGPAFEKDRTYSQGELPLHRFRFVAPGFFKTLGTPLVAGRDLTWSDIYNKVPVAIVSERMAREYWHDPASALGKQIRVDRKSTRLNSSHPSISYAVFCLKKKKQKHK